jgi:hypothetical protein
MQGELDALPVPVETLTVCTMPETDSPKPLSPDNTGSSGRSYATTRSGTFRQPSVSRRGSISSAVGGIDVNDIGKPQSKEQIAKEQAAHTPKAERPGHKRSFTGQLDRLTPDGRRASVQGSFRVSGNGGR